MAIKIRQLSDKDAYQLVNDLISYCPKKGLFKWKHRDKKYFQSDRQYKNWNSRYSGKITGNKHKEGYIQIKIFEQQFLAHRLAWLITYQEWPKNQLDHIDRNRSNNKIANLRISSPTENMRNLSLNKNNTSGFTGVGYLKNRKKWQATITVNRKMLHIGLYEKIEDAALARIEKEKELGYKKYETNSSQS